jgi:hypothetical protein
MSNEVTQAKTLQERVGDRIREQIGDLMTDDDLRLLVDRALTDAFFKERRETRHYGQDIIHPPPVVELVRDLLKQRVDAAAAVWLAEHKDELGKHIDNAIGKGFLTFFTQWLDVKMQNDLNIFGNAIRDRLGLR